MARVKSTHLKELEEISLFIEQVPITSLEELDKYVRLEGNEKWIRLVQNPAFRYYFYRYIQIFVLGKNSVSS